MNEQETITTLLVALASGQPFAHVRFGDGDVFFATSSGPRVTADGERWSTILADQLQTSWREFQAYPGPLYLGDVESYDVSDGCEDAWKVMLDEMVRGRRVNDATEATLVHIEALRAARPSALAFYLGLHADPRRTAWVAPPTLAAAADLIGAAHIEIPLGTSHWAAHETAELLIEAEYEIAVFAAGRGGKIMQGLLAKHAPGIIQIDVGSGLDILYPDGVRRGVDRLVDEDSIRRLYQDTGLLA